MELMKGCEELCWNPERSTPRTRRSETNRRAARVNKGTSPVSVHFGFQESWWCHCYIRNVQDLVADGQPLCERPFNSPFRKTDYLVWNRSKIYPISSKDQGPVHQFGTKVCPGIFAGYALNAGRSWTGDLLIVNTEDLLKVT